MSMWSFRPCRISIQEAVNKNIRVGPTSERTKREKALLGIGPHNIPKDDPRCNLFSILGPDNNPFDREQDVLSILLADKEEDLANFAKDCWNHLNIFGSATNLVRALQKLEKELVPESVKGDFYRLKEALKILLPGEEIKGRKQTDLSRFLEDYCNQVSTGIKQAPEIEEGLKYSLIRLNYGSDRGEHAAVAFRHQFEDTTVPVKAVTVDLDHAEKGGQPVQEETVLLPKYQTTHSLRYKTMVLKASDTSKSHCVVRVLPRSDGTDLEVTEGSNVDNEGNMLLRDGIQRALGNSGLDYAVPPDPPRS